MSRTLTCYFLNNTFSIEHNPVLTWPQNLVPDQLVSDLEFSYSPEIY